MHQESPKYRSVALYRAQALTELDPPGRDSFLLIAKGKPPETDRAVSPRRVVSKGLDCLAGCPRCRAAEGSVAEQTSRNYGSMTMEVILLDHIEDLGTVGQTVKVKNGYARNYLFPRKLACEATEKKLNFYRTLIEAKKRKLAKAKDAAQEQADQLKAMTLTFLRKSRGEDSRLFGSVTNADIAAALEQKGFEIDRKTHSHPRADQEAWRTSCGGSSPS